MAVSDVPQIAASPDLLAVSRSDLLIYLQSRLILAVEMTPGKDLAPLSKELRALTAELEALAPVKESSVDDLTTRRAARRAKASG